MRPRALVVHRLPRRTRLRIPALRHDTDRLHAVADALTKCPGAISVHTNDVTSSILIEHDDGNLEVIALYAQESDLFDLELEQPRLPEASTGAILDRGLTRLDGWLRTETSDQSTLGSVVMAALLAGAAWQVARGQALPAAATLAWYALALAPERTRQLLVTGPPDDAVATPPKEPARVG